MIQKNSLERVLNGRTMHYPISTLAPLGRVSFIQGATGGREGLSRPFPLEMDKVIRWV